MSDGQFFVFYILGPETAVILVGWWIVQRIRLHRARTRWQRQLEQRRRRQYAHQPTRRRRAS